MHVRRAILENVGRIQKLDVKLPCGLIGIFGPNGSGKSTFLEALYSCLTNDFGCFDGPKTDIINFQAGSKDESSIYLEVVHNDHVLEIYRGIRPAKHSLIIDGGKAITDANKLQPLIYEHLGVDKQILNRFVFKRQNKVYDFLDAIDSERKKAFQYISGTEHCEAIWKILGDKLNQDESLRETLVDNSDDLRAQLQTIDDSLQRLHLSISEQQALLLNAKSLATANRLVEHHNKCEGWQQDVKELEEKLPKARRAYRKRRARVTQAQEAYDAAQNVLEAKKRDEPKLRAEQEQWDDYNDYVSEREELEQERDELTRDTRKSPAKPKVKINAEQVREQLAGLRSDFKRAQEIVRKFDDEGLAVCPTCGTAVTEMEDHLNEQRARLAELPSKIKELSASLATWEEYLKLVQDHQRWEAGHEARVKGNAVALGKLKVVAEPARSPTVLKKALAEIDVADAESKRQAKALSGLKEMAATARERYVSCKSRLAKLKERLAKYQVPPKKLQKAQKRLAEHQVAEQAIARLEGEKAALERQAGVLREDLAKLQRKLVRNRCARKLAKILEEARDVLHRDNLPAKVSQQNLLALEEDLNRGLELFGPPFTAEAAENLTFVIHKAGEPPQSSAKLSVGQRCVLAISFWLSLRRLGMLALDEPTANLDDANQAYLAAALETLSGRIREERQVFVVTHAPGMRRVFDAVIELT